MLNSSQTVLLQLLEAPPGGEGGVKGCHQEDDHSVCTVTIQDGL